MNSKTYVMTRIVLIDSCSFTYYRVTATMAWCKKSGHSYGSQSSISSANSNSAVEESSATEEPSVAEPDEEFNDLLVSQYQTCIAKLSRKIAVPVSQMYLVRDCPREEIWRLCFYSNYKANRADRSTSVGPYIKHLNTVYQSQYKAVLRVDNAEADDVIAVLTYFLSSYGYDIHIVTCDSDLDQLLVYPNVTIHNPKGGWTSKSGPTEDPLPDKISKGDQTDNIPASLDPYLKSLLIDLSYVPRLIQDRTILAWQEAHTQEDGTSPYLLHSNFRPMPIQLGLCCINTELQDRNIICSRTMRLDTLEKRGLEELYKRARQNCADLITHIHWNAENGIRAFRISSEIFPHKSNHRAQQYTLDFAKDLLQEAGRLARFYKQRLTFHPGQYNVIGTPREDAFESTVRDLDWHAEVLDLMGVGPDGVLVVHGGGTYGDKEATKRRWVSNFARLPERVQRRLVLENCEKSFSILDCLQVSEMCQQQYGFYVPIVFDSHHFECYRASHGTGDPCNAEPAEYIPAVLETWSSRGMKPKFHVSEQAPDKQMGAHSDYIEKIPEYLLEVPARYGVWIDIMIEAKMKERAIKHLYEIYPDLDPLH